MNDVRQRNPVLRESVREALSQPIVMILATNFGGLLSEVRLKRVSEQQQKKSWKVEVPVGSTAFSAKSAITPFLRGCHSSLNDLLDVERSSTLTIRSIVLANATYVSLSLSVEAYVTKSA